MNNLEIKLFQKENCTELLQRNSFVTGGHGIKQTALYKTVSRPWNRLIRAKNIIYQKGSL